MCFMGPSVEDCVVWNHTHTSDIVSKRLHGGFVAAAAPLHDQQEVKGKSLRMQLLGRDLQHLSIMCARRYELVCKAEQGYCDDKVSPLDKLELAVFEVGTGEELDDAPWWLRSENGFTICDDSQDLSEKERCDDDDVGEDESLETIILNCSEDVFSLSNRGKEGTSDFLDIDFSDIHGLNTAHQGFRRIYDTVPEETPDMVHVTSNAENIPTDRSAHPNRDAAKSFTGLDKVEESADNTVATLRCGSTSTPTADASPLVNCKFDAVTEKFGNTSGKDTLETDESDNSNDKPTAAASAERLDRLVSRHRYRSGDSRELMVLSLVDVFCHNGLFAGMQSDRARQVALFMNKIQRNSLIIFDWDDTILPTAWLRGNGALNNSPFALCGLDAMHHMSSRARNWMSYYCTLVRVTLQMASTLGRVVIVSNSCENWMQKTAELFMSDAAPELRLCEIISARSEYSKDCDEPQQWKFNCFDDIVRRWAEQVRANTDRSFEENDFNQQGWPNTTANMRTVVPTTRPVSSARLGSLKLFAGPSEYDQLFWRESVPTSRTAIGQSLSTLYNKVDDDTRVRTMLQDYRADDYADEYHDCGLSNSGDTGNALSSDSDVDSDADELNYNADNCGGDVPFASALLSDRHSQITPRPLRRIDRETSGNKGGGPLCFRDDMGVPQVKSRVSSASERSLLSTDCEDAPGDSCTREHKASSTLDALKRLKAQFYPEVACTSLHAPIDNRPHMRPTTDKALFDLSSSEFSPHFDKTPELDTGKRNTAQQDSTEHTDSCSSSNSKNCSTGSGSADGSNKASYDQKIQVSADDVLQVLSVGDSVHERNACLATSTSLNVRVKSVKLKLRPDIETLAEQHLMLQQLMFEMMGTSDVPIVDLMIRCRKSESVTLFD
eukprot:Lankesteria_metandrocarpae@DN3257_c0_g1_i2.p1